MSKFVIFQEQLKCELYDDVNSLGWDGVFKKHPQLRVVMDLQSGLFENIDKSKFTELFNAHYLASAEVDCNSRSEIFHLSNMGQVDRLHNRCRSASVGDVIYDVSKDEYWLIENVGLLNVTRYI